MGVTDLMAGFGLPGVTIPHIHVFSKLVSVGSRSDDAKSNFYNFKTPSLKSLIQQPPTCWLGEIVTAGDPSHLLATLLILKRWTCKGLLFIVNDFPQHMQCPDPHFKKKHHKRRVLQKPLVGAIVDNLSPGGQVYFLHALIYRTVGIIKIV